MSRLIALVFGLAAVVAGIVSSKVLAQQPNVEAAKKEGKVVIYGTIVPQVMTQIEKGFEAKYGIKTEYWRADATKVIDRVLTEWRAGKPGFDVVIGARGPLALGKQDNVYAKYSPASTANFPAKFKDKDGQLIAWRLTPVGVLYNTELVRPADVPKSFDDLLDPKWQNKISMPDPSRHASTAQFLWNLQQVKGDKWMDFVRGLAKQKPLLQESYSTVSNVIVRGESQLGITYIQYAAQTKGPIDFAPLDKAFADPSDVALSAKAANLNAAKVFIDYLCSPEGKRRLRRPVSLSLRPVYFRRLKAQTKLLPTCCCWRTPAQSS